MLSYCTHKTFIKSLICKPRYIVEEFRPLFQLYLFFFFFEGNSYFPDLGNDFAHFFLVCFNEVIILNGKEKQAVVELKDMDRGEISPETRKRQSSLAALGFAGKFCVAFRCQISVSAAECHGYLLDFTRGEGGKMRRSDGLQQLKFLLLVSFSGVIFPYYVPAH